MLEDIHERINMLALEDERRLELEHVVKGALGAEQDAAALHALDDIVRFPVSGFERVAISNQFDAEEEARTAHLPDDGEVRLQGLQALHPIAAGLVGVLLQVFIGDDVEHFQADSTGDRIAAEGIEIFHAVSESGGDLWRGDDSAERMSVGDGLAQSDNVGHDAAQFK